LSRAATKLAAGLALTIACGALQGCAAARHDLAKSFDCTLHLGPGLGFRAAVTRWFEVGLIAVGPAEAPTHDLPSVNVAAGVRNGEVSAWSIESVEYGVSPWYHADTLQARLDPRGTERRFDPTNERGVKQQLQLHLALIGIELGFDPRSFGCFVADLFGRTPPPELPPADENGGDATSERDGASETNERAVDRG
jgi:hypothetical protein